MVVVIPTTAAYSNSGSKAYLPTAAYIVAIVVVRPTYLLLHT